MSVYIQGMEMPKSCGYCPIRHLGGDGDECFLGAKITEYQKRPDDCPLLPVPDHGRLIDADAYRAEMKKRQDACAEWRDDIKDGGGYGTELYYRADSFLGAMCEAKLTLDKMPTIIPADKEDGK